MSGATDSDLSVLCHQIERAHVRAGHPLDSDARAELHSACESIGRRLAAAERATRDLAKRLDAAEHLIAAGCRG